MSEKKLPPLPAGASFEPPPLPKGASLESPSAKEQTLYTEETVYDPATGLPISSVAYGPEAKGGTKVAQKALTTLAGVPVNYAMSTAKPIAGVTQLASQILGTNAGEQPLQAINQIERGVNQASYAPVTKTASFVGDIANPLTFGIANKGMQLGQKIPALPSFDRLTNAYRAGAGGAIGGFALGLTTPEETGLTPEQFAEQKGKTLALNTGVGAVAPSVVKLGETAFKGARSLAEPLYQAGQERILGRALREAAGGEADKAVANLRNYKPSVAGTQLTAGEVAGVPSLAATQRSVMATSPEATNLVAARQSANAQARTQALENIASDTRFNKYATLRDTLGDELYTPALNTAMDFATLTKPMQKEVQSLANTPAIKQAMEKARENALNKNIDIGDPRGSLRGLHETKMALDREIKAVKAKLVRDQAGATSAELDGLNAAKDRLLNFIETVSPEYKTARQTYARLSKPVEQLERIRGLAEKAINPKDQQLYAGRFFNQLEALKKEGVLTPRQIQRLEAIADDLRRADFAQTAGRGVGSDTVQKLAYTNMLKQAGIPSMLQNIPAGQVLGNVVGRAGDVLYGGANRQLTSQLAEALMNPAETARLMEMGAKQTSPVLTQQQRNLAKVLMMQQLGFQGE